MRNRVSVSANTVTQHTSNQRGDRVRRVANSRRASSNNRRRIISLRSVSFSSTRSLILSRARENERVTARRDKSHAREFSFARAREEMSRRSRRKCLREDGKTRAELHVSYVKRSVLANVTFRPGAGKKTRYYPWHFERRRSCVRRRDCFSTEQNYHSSGSELSSILLPLFHRISAHARATFRRRRAPTRRNLRLAAPQIWTLREDGVHNLPLLIFLLSFLLDSPCTLIVSPVF